MTKNNVMLKDSLSIIDKINMIRYIVGGYFVGDDYTPYYADINKLIAFFKYCIDGLEFDEDDDIYTLSLSDPKLMELYYIGMREGSPIHSTIEEVMNIVDDMVDFYKKKALISSSPILKKLEDILDKELKNKDEELKLTKQMEKVMEENERQLKANNDLAALLTPEETAMIMKKFSSEDFNAENFVTAISDAYMNSYLYENNNNSLLDEKNKKIVELQSLLNVK